MEYILAMFGFDKESRKELFTLSSLIWTVGIMTLILVVGYLEGI